MSESNPVAIRFSDLNLPATLLSALDEVGYEIPTPIQAQTIPHLLQGLDLLGHAPTGTGKTAAFALPLLARIDIANPRVQVMTLAPTRELAIQVAEAFQRYASHIKGFHVLPIYGGQDYTGQIRQLKRGVHVVVGTPGRVMDHMRKGTLKLDGLQALVLDEADEMLRMGFIDEVEWILEQAPPKRQMALFSATMPKEIERIARRHLNNPQEISIQAKTATAETIRQRFWQVSGHAKLDALTRILEVEPFDAILIFVRTKSATTELAERLEARGYSAAAMNGDMAQAQREQMVDRLKKGALDILVATDVAARGLDVTRISHVINYDIPYDAEAYIHRIGRTGRAGRTGEAILFVAPRERRMLGAIEKATRQKIEQLQLPTTETVNNKRIADFKQKITDTLASGELAFMQGLIEQYRQEHDVPALEIASALAQMSLGNRELLMKPDSERPASSRKEYDRDARREPRSGREGKGREQRRDASPRRQLDAPVSADMERYRIAVGHSHGVKPGNIVGAIANEAGLDGKYIGHIEISNEFSLVDLPVGMPEDVLRDLIKVRVCGQALKISREQTHTSTNRGKSKADDDKPRSKSDYAKPKTKSSYDKPKAKSSYDKPRSKSDYAKPKSKSDYAKPGAKSDHARPKAKSEYDTPKPKSDYAKPRSTKSKEGKIGLKAPSSRMPLSDERKVKISTKPKAQPESRAGSRPGARPGSKSPARPGSKFASQKTAKTGSGSGAKPGSKFGGKTGARPGSPSGAKPGSRSGTRSSSGNNPGSRAGSDSRGPRRSK